MKIKGVVAYLAGTEGSRAGRKPMKLNVCYACLIYDGTLTVLA